MAGPSRAAGKSGPRASFRRASRVGVRKAMAARTVAVWDPEAKASSLLAGRRRVPESQWALEMRSALPRLWSFALSSSSARAESAQRLPSSGSGGLGSTPRTRPVRLRLSFVELRQGLARLQGPMGATLSSLRDTELAAAALRAAQLPPLRMPRGFRFADNSRTGSWSVDNLVGYKNVKAGDEEKIIVWDVNCADFGLRLCDGDPGGLGLELRCVPRRLAVGIRASVRRRGGLRFVREPFFVTGCNRREQAVDRRRKIKVMRGVCDLLPAVIFRPLLSQQQWTLIYLHGMGSSATANYSDRPHYFVDGSVSLKVVLPTAPSREVSCFDSWWVPALSSKPKARKWRLVRFRSWYDYLSNYDGKQEDRIDYESLLVLQRALHTLIRNEAKELGGRTDRIIMGGKSQGCCTAFDAAMTFPDPLGGFIGTVGHVLCCTPVEPGGPQCRTPLHFFHEPSDRMMRWSWVRTGEERLREAGYCLRSRRISDPEVQGHFIDGVEGRWLRSALRKVCAAGAAPNSLKRSSATCAARRGRAGGAAEAASAGSAAKRAKNAGSS